MPDHMTDAEREARDAVHAITAVGHKMTCASVKFIKPDRYTGLDKYGSSGEPCDCGADANREATLDAYAAAVRAAERDRCLAVVEGVWRQHSEPATRGTNGWRYAITSDVEDSALLLFECGILERHRTKDWYRFAALRGNTNEAPVHD